MRILPRAVSAAVLAIGMTAPAASRDDSIVWAKGGWRVQMLVTPTNPLGCQAIKGFASTHNAQRSAAWGFLSTAAGRWGLAMIGPAAEQMIGRQVTVTVDDALVIVATPRRLTSGLIMIGELPADRMGAVASGRWLRLATPTSSARFHLGGAEEALSAVLRCSTAVREAAARHVAPASPIPSPNREASSSTPSPRLSAGTGFYVSKSGDIITNAHVVQGCSSIAIKGHGDDAKFRAARVRASDTVQDLAILIGDSPPAIPPTILSWRRDTGLGEPIAIFGFPYLGTLATSGTFERGHVSALAGFRNNSSQFQLSAPVQPGNSGGPVVDERGYVVGVVVAKLNALAVAREKGDIPQNVNFAIKSAQAISFMEAHGVAVDVGDRTLPTLSGPDVAHRLQTAAVLVMCAGDGRR